MFELFQMWALVEVLGIISLPLTMTVFHNLPDRGWAFSKAIGITLLAFCVWLPLMLLHVLPFSQLFILGVALLLLALNLIGFVRMRHSIVKMLRTNIPYIIATEVVFLGMVFLLGWLRSYSPEIRSFEMFMDEGFIAAIMRSTHFPPNDMWFAGYSLNYYYYAHFTAAMLAKLLGQAPAVVFNTGISMFFGLTAANLFGVTCNIVAWGRHLRKRIKLAADIEAPDTIHISLSRAIPYGLLTMLMGLLLGNLAATQEWFKAHGDLAQFDWFMPSRVIDRTINEFPAFSFLLSCFHAHVLALAFTILAIGLAFNLFLEHDGRGLFVFGHGFWRLPLALVVTAMVLGSLFTMNGWDFPTYIGLAVVCIGVQQWLAYDRQFRWELVLDIITASAALVALSFLLFAPFYLNFVSPSQGIGILGAQDRTPLQDEVLIYGLFAFMFLSLLIASALKQPLMGWKARAFSHETVDEGIATRNAAVTARESKLTFRIAVVITLLSLALALAILIFVPNSTTLVVTTSIAALGVILMFYHINDRSLAFTLLLGSLAFTLIAGCEVFFLRDVFVNNTPPLPRMNTVFKFYFQAWALLSISSGAGLFFILDSFRLARIASIVQRRVLYAVEGVWCVGLLLLVLAGVVYPVAGSYNRTNHFIQRSDSLDGLAYMQAGPSGPGDYDAIRWLNTNIQGDPVIIEAVGDDYSAYARVSAFTGLPTPMGWVGHEYQWRVNWFNNPTNAIEFNRRGGDVDTIYKDPDPHIVLSAMANYDAQYLYVGPLEYQKYPTANLHRFSAYMQVVYSAEGVTIYKVK